MHTQEVICPHCGEVAFVNVPTPQHNRCGTTSESTCRHCKEKLSCKLERESTEEKEYQIVSVDVDYGY